MYLSFIIHISLAHYIRNEIFCHRQKVKSTDGGWNPHSADDIFTCGKYEGVALRRIKKPSSTVYVKAGVGSIQRKYAEK